MNPYEETLIRARDAERADEMRALQLSEPSGAGPRSEGELFRFAMVLHPRRGFRRLAATIAGRLRGGARSREDVAPEHVPAPAQVVELSATPPGATAQVVPATSPVKPA
jgi:hypothetical protein